jgi:hypothetical protein
VDRASQRDASIGFACRIVVIGWSWSKLVCSDCPDRRVVMPFLQPKSLRRLPPLQRREGSGRVEKPAWKDQIFVTEKH